MRSHRFETRAIGPSSAERSGANPIVSAVVPHRLLLLSDHESRFKEMRQVSHEYIYTIGNLSPKSELKSTAFSGQRRGMLYCDHS